MRQSRANGMFKDVPDAQWNDWHWQVENRIETLEDLKKHMTLTPEEEEGIQGDAGQASHGDHAVLPLPDRPR